MVWQADFLTIYKECTESNFSNVALMIDLVLNIEAYFANQVSRYRSFCQTRAVILHHMKSYFSKGYHGFPYSQITSSTLYLLQSINKREKLI